MKSLRKYFQNARDFSERIDTALIRFLFNRFYDPRNAVSSSRILRVDYGNSDRRNPLDTSFLGRDYLLDHLREFNNTRFSKRT